MQYLPPTPIGFDKLNELLKGQIEQAQKEIEDLCVEEGVEVHGLIVGPRRTPNFKEIVGTNLHVFDDWRVFNENDDY